MERKAIIYRINTVFCYGLLAFFSWLMLLITLQYIPLDTDVAFLRIKQEQVQHAWYRLAFFTHVYTAMFALLAGFVQFSSYIRSKYMQLHKVSGRIYVWSILALSGPSGLVMAFNANGGPVAQTAFVLLAILWLWFTWKGLETIIKGDIEAHKRFMCRSYALTLSAITLRLWKYLIVMAFHPKPMDTYRVVAWLGWVLNLLVIECIIRYREKKKQLNKVCGPLHAGVKYEMQ